MAQQMGDIAGGGRSVVCPLGREGPEELQQPQVHHRDDLQPFAELGGGVGDF